ncbi:uncharacterized protein BJ212DRAFT_1489799 [Suillus subaureus]|uniref:Uncharacterized protein n=1 Tax=Suillus subaureus TaxID=48587 RepID=A0A9P7ARX0_9AGAM|nr:uncharacterized protein BJ212DRAFT_1489799 [Suillus subaureus]KAG1795246.1 hypothetical protein BJ212DRAFT_1489799 [Suillus subaureus]
MKYLTLGTLFTIFGGKDFAPPGKPLAERVKVAMLGPDALILSADTDRPCGVCFWNLRMNSIRNFMAQAEK